MIFPDNRKSISNTLEDKISIRPRFKLEIISFVEYARKVLRQVFKRPFLSSYSWKMAKHFLIKFLIKSFPRIDTK